MAFTRKFLQALGIEADKIDEIVSAHTEVTEGLKSERDEYKTKAEKLDGVQKELDTANAELAKYSEKGEVVAKSEFDKVKKEYEEYKSEIELKELNSKKEHAYRDMLKLAGISENRIDTILKASKDEIEKVEFDEDGKMKDAEQRTESAKEEWADFVVNSSTNGAETKKPPENESSKKDPFEIGFDEE